MVSVTDLAGKVFGKLTVVERQGSRNGRAIWKCRCDCGNEVDVTSKRLLGGVTQSCGCLIGEFNRRTKSKHGMNGTPTYASWQAMLSRATNPNHHAFDRYGGRGIGVCARWKKFENFLADMGERPSKIYSIERKDNNKGYYPGNCKWATRKEQQNNRRGTPSETVRRDVIHLLGFHTVSDVATLLNISEGSVRRIRREEYD